MRECLKQFVNHGIDVLGNISKQASCFMNLWYIITVIRIVSIYSVGNDLYSDERGSFQCATKQFLCRTGCHDQFMPIKLTRFWTWHTHLLIMSVLLMNWLSDSSICQMLCGKSTESSPQRGNISRRICSFVQSALLLGLELIFAYIFCQLLAKQYSPREKLESLFQSGELFFTPSVYLCQLEKTFTAKEERLYFDKENIKFRESPAGLRVKAQLACAQSEPLCSIERSSEKTIVVLGMSMLNCLAMLTLSFELMYQALKLGKEFSKQRQPTARAKRSG